MATKKTKPAKAKSVKKAAKPKVAVKAPAKAAKAKAALPAKAAPKGKPPAAKAAPLPKTKPDPKGKALVPEKPGPRRAHKLSADVVDFVLQQQAEDPTLGSSQLVERVRERFGCKVHPRSIERALARRKKKRP